MKRAWIVAPVVTGLAVLALVQATRGPAARSAGPPGASRPVAHSAGPLAPFRPTVVASEARPGESVTFGVITLWNRGSSAVTLDQAIVEGLPSGMELLGVFSGPPDRVGTAYGRPQATGPVGGAVVLPGRNHVVQLSFWLEPTQARDLETQGIRLLYHDTMHSFVMVIPVRFRLLTAT